MSIHAVDKTFSQFLSPTETTLYVIPTYQREYSWGTDHCGDLINDINENETNYFIGSIIWVTTTREIIDGQQRLTSLSLLLAAIYERLSSFEEDEDLMFKKSSLKRMIVSGDSCRLILQRQGKNKEDFEYIIKSSIIRCSCSKPLNFGNRRVSHNFNYFKEVISEYSKEDLFELYDKICALTFVSAEVDNSQTAFILFETMNNRGMELSAIDLIKSSYMSRTSDEDSISRWENLIAILGSESNQEQFLRNNYNAFRKEYNHITGLVNDDTRYEIANKATRSNVIKIYSTLCQENGFIDFITENAKYNSALTGEENLQIEIPDSFEDVFSSFRNANATSSFTLLLYLLRYQIPYNLTDEQMVNIFNQILKFFIRRNLTNTPSTGAIPQILMDIIASINAIQNPSYDAILETINGTFRDKTAPDDIVRTVLGGDIYESNRDMARYLLCSLCVDSGNNERRFIDLWEKRDDKYIWTIEHILPEGNKDASNTPRHWIEMIKAGNADYADYSDERIIELVRQYRHKIGNLTMTGYNSSLGNRAFDQKKNRFDTSNNPIGYNNGLNLNGYVYAQDFWTINNIEERTNNIIDLIMNNIAI